MEYQTWAKEIAEKIYQKSLIVAKRNADKIPYTTENGVFDDWSNKNICWWTNGFWAGQLWLLYSYRKNEVFKEIAENIEKKLDENMMTAWGMDHDSGFRWLLTSGANYRLTGNLQSKNRLLLAANNMAGRFNLNGRFIRAWNDDGDGKTAGWAIIDCMMNLPLLYWASKETNDPRFAQIAVAHANTAMKNFIREDGSSNHIVSFDPNTGKMIESFGGQGKCVGSSWTRGQGWAIYGFALSYLHTKDEAYLETSERVASYLLKHIPENGVVPVDFLQDEGLDWEDSTASAIISCGFIELYRITKKVEYLSMAIKLLKVLAETRSNLNNDKDNLIENCSAAYHDEKHNFAIIYGDYYFTEAILKLCEEGVFLW